MKQLLAFTFLPQFTRSSSLVTANSAALPPLLRGEKVFPPARAPALWSSWSSAISLDGLEAGELCWDLECGKLKGEACSPPRTNSGADKVDWIAAGVVEKTQGEPTSWRPVKLNHADKFCCKSWSLYWCSNVSCTTSSPDSSRSTWTTDSRHTLVPNDVVNTMTQCQRMFHVIIN